MKRVLTPSFVRTAPKPKGKAAEALYLDSQVQGLALRVTPAGARSYLFLWQTPLGNGRYRKHRARLDEISSALFDTKAAAPIRGVFINGEEIGDVRARIAQPMRLRVEQSLPAIPHAESGKPSETHFENVVERFLALHSSKNRTHDETKRILEHYVLQAWRGRSIVEIRRSDVAALLDKVAMRKVIHPKTGKAIGGPVQVDHVLAQVRKLMNWYATRDDDYVSPIVRGMARTKPKERARTRVLSDEEIRAVWAVLPQFGVFGAVVKTLFLTAQRRGEVSAMLRLDIGGQDGIWAIDPEKYKTKRPQFVPLSKDALTHIKAQTTVTVPAEGGEPAHDSDLVYTLNGKTPFKSFGGKLMAQFNAAVLTELKKAAQERGENPAKVALKPWVLHDIRRTAKTLMSRAGVQPYISERVLGHVIPGVEGTYDRYSYADEKRDALERLAALLKQIVTPHAANVIPFQAAAE